MNLTRNPYFGEQRNVSGIGYFGELNIALIHFKFCFHMQNEKNENDKFRNRRDVCG